MLAAIDAAQRTVRLETYIYAAGSLGDRFREALVRAAQRGVRVRVLIDALGSSSLPAAFWDPLLKVGGEMRRFNPLSINRLSIRNHRKMLVCDEHIGFVGGFNIASEYEGDGVKCGWCDLGLHVDGKLAEELASTFDEMFARADFRHKRFLHFPRFKLRETVLHSEQLLLSGLGSTKSQIKGALHRDLAQARSVQIMVAYFLPSWRVRRSLIRVARSGGRVQLILAGKSDVLLSQLAAQSLYRRLLRAGIEIYEYQPQILHAKLIVIDDIVYAGSANLDHRSLNINYELMIRFKGRDMAQRARQVFERNLQHSKQITREEWRRSRNLWRRLKQRWAYFFLVRIDPYIAQRQWRALPD
jgi:cardiolipin synthase